MNNLITVNNLAISYDGRNIIENVSFNVESGDFLVIFGENGSGKSSLVKALLGLKAPSRGEIAFSHDLKQNEIGYLPQSQVIKKDFPASVWEVVLSGCLNKMGIRPFYTKKEKETARKNMELLSVYDLKNACFRNLSGGQIQRVLLARALCAAQKLIILDEPVSGLDQSSTKDFYDSIKKINQSGMAVIMISHDINKSLHLAKHILNLSGSDTYFYANAEDFRKEE